jgi:hypothetical protein
MLLAPQVLTVAFIFNRIFMPLSAKASRRSTQELNTLAPQAIKQEEH